HRAVHCADAARHPVPLSVDRLGYQALGCPARSRRRQAGRGCGPRRSGGAEGGPRLVRDQGQHRHAYRAIAGDRRTDRIPFGYRADAHPRELMTAAGSRAQGEGTRMIAKDSSKLAERSPVQAREASRFSPVTFTNALIEEWLRTGERADIMEEYFG